MLAGERAGDERKIIMYRGTPAIFFQYVNLVIFQQIMLGEPCSNLFRVGLHSYFKAVYNKSRPTLCNKMSGCQSFCGFMYLLKMEPPKFYPRGHPQKI